MTSLSLVDLDLSALDSDALIVGVVAGNDGPSLAPGAELIDEALGGRLLDALRTVGATGSEGDITKVATLGALPHIPLVVGVGLGSAVDTYPDEIVRRATGTAVRVLSGQSKLACVLSMVNGAPTAHLMQAVGEGALLGAYQFTRYKNEHDTNKAAPSVVGLAAPAAAHPSLETARDRASTVAAAVNLCRDLVNLPPNDLCPADLAEHAQSAGTSVGLDVEILDEQTLAANGYGGILAVGGGSSRPPRLVRMTYREGSDRTLALVGKGITFDSGGLSLKPSDKMDEMKADMAGAAAVIATMTAIAQLALPLTVIATIPMAENLPSGSAYRPADVLRMYGGKSVEVLNTDAEGRLILGDAIARACEDSPDYLVEVSTLTGAQVIALGNRTTGAMGSENLRDRVVAAATSAGEDVWSMPLPRELRKGLEASTIADLVNAPVPKAGRMLVGGHFLSYFVAEGVQWTHLDIAGPAFNTEEPWGYNPKGGTGTPVRSIIKLAEDIAEHG